MARGPDSLQGYTLSFSTGQFMSHTSRDQTQLLGRVRRLKGQIETVERAAEGGKDCGTILHLVAAIRGAMAGLTNELTGERLTHPVVAAEDAESRRKAAEELSFVLRTYLK